MRSPSRYVAMLVASLLLGAPLVSAAQVLIDNFRTNGGVSDPAIGLDSPGATGPTNRIFAGLGTNAIGDRTTFLEVPSPGVPSGGYAYVEPTGAGTALFYNIGLSVGVTSMHSISWAAGNFDLLSAVGVSSPSELFFKLDFGDNNFPATTSQTFEMLVSSAGGSALYSTTVNSIQLAGNTNFSALLNFQSGTFNASNVSVQLSADLAFAGANNQNQFEFTEVSVVPEPSTVALVGTALGLFVLMYNRRRASR